MFLKEHVHFLTLCILSKYDWIIFSKLVISQLWNKYENVLEKFKCFCNLYATKVNNNLEITSVRFSLDLGNKFELENHLLTIVFHFKNPRLGFWFLPPVSFEII